MHVRLAFHKVGKRFGRICAVDGVDFTVSAGEMVAVVGPDGAGKTTTARLGAGALAPTSGKVEPDLRGAVGYLPGRFSLYPDLTVWENLLFFARLHGMGGPDLRAEAYRLLDWVGLLPFRERRAGALSGGMRQKLALCAAVIHRPPVLILDEPTTAVDPVAREEFWLLLHEQAGEGRAVLLTTPYLDEAERCHRVALLHEGRLLAVDAVPALKRRFPLQMALLMAEGAPWHRQEAVQAAERLPGRHWTQPLGTAVRVALAPDAPLDPPDGYRLELVAPTLEDVYVWMSGALTGVSNS